MKLFIPPFVLITLLYCQCIFAQKKTCSSPDSEILLDPNSVTKCSIIDVESSSNTIQRRKTRRLNIVVSSRRKRNLTKKIASTIGSGRKLNVDQLRRRSALVGSSLNIKEENHLTKSVLFAMIEEKPLFQKCKNASKSNQSNCFNKQLANHVVRNLNYPERALWHQMEGKFLATFVIDEKGIATNIQIKGSKNASLLEEEAKRVIAILPKFIPGKFKDTPVKVSCSVPINFKLPQEYITKNNYRSLDHIISFENVESVPEFPSCNTLSENEKSDCFHKEMMKHIQENFKYPKLAVEDHIEGKINATFVISKKGNITDIQVVGPENTTILERAAKKLIEKLPKFTPGKEGDKYVDVKYSIPINFKIH